MDWLAQVTVPDKLDDQNLIVLVIFMSFLLAVFGVIVSIVRSQQRGFERENDKNRVQEKELREADQKLAAQERNADRELHRGALERMQESFLQGIKNLDVNSDLRMKQNLAGIGDLKHDILLFDSNSIQRHAHQATKLGELHKTMEDNHIATKEILDIARNMTLLLEDIMLQMQKGHTADIHGIQEMKQIIEQSHTADMSSIQETMGVLRQLADKIQVNLDQGK